VLNNFQSLSKIVVLSEDNNYSMQFGIRSWRNNLSGFRRPTAVGGLPQALKAMLFKDGCAHRAGIDSQEVDGVLLRFACPRDRGALLTVFSN